MSQAHAQDRQLAGERANQVHADARLLRSARAGRDDNPLGMEGFDLADRELVIAADHHLSPEFAQVLNEVVGERVVIIENENHVLPSGYNKSAAHEACPWGDAVAFRQAARTRCIPPCTMTR